jgi:lysozyme
MPNLERIDMNLARMLENEEGRVPHAYQDHLGYWTIGVGRLIDSRKGGGLSDDEIDYLLQNDIKNKAAEVIKALPWVAGLSEVRQAVIIGMAFQMGTAGLLGFKNTLAMVRDGDFPGAARNMMLSRWAEQTPTRARRMAAQMETGEWILEA